MDLKEQLNFKLFYELNIQILTIKSWLKLMAFNCQGDHYLSLDYRK